MGNNNTIASYIGHSRVKASTPVQGHARLRGHDELVEVNVVLAMDTLECSFLKKRRQH